MRYTLFVPEQAVGANAVHFDLFNASGSTYTMYVESVVPVVSGDEAVTGVVAADVFLTRTTAVGTGGTANTREGTALDAATICATDSSQICPPEITARLTPSGGATAGAVLAHRSLFTEETSSGTYTQVEMVKTPITVPEGKGIRVVQGAVASVGEIGWNVVFSLQSKTF
jgi:hypothetical protein